MDKSPTNYSLKQDRVFNSSGFKMLLDMVKLSLIKSECSTAQLSLSLFVLFFCCNRYVAFVELINLNDLLDNVTFYFRPIRSLEKIDRRMDDRKVTYRARLPLRKRKEKRKEMCDRHTHSHTFIVWSQ